MKLSTVIALTLVAAGASSISGCVTVKTITAPDGRAAYAISCGGPHTLASCYDKAAEACHGPYTVIGGETGSRGFITGNPYMVTGGSIPQRTMIVECNT